jgi:hypothetical protein
MTHEDIEAQADRDVSDMRSMALELARQFLPVSTSGGVDPERVEDFAAAYEVGFTMGLKKFSIEMESTWRFGVSVGFVSGCVFTLALCLIVFWPWLSPR